MKKRISKAIKRCRCPNNNLFITALIAFILFLLVELTIRIYDLYKDAPFVDIPSHFFGGVALFIGIFWIISLTTIKKKKFVALTLAFISAIVWEVFETLQEFVIYNPPHMKDIFFWDGFWDVIFTFLGALGGLLILYFLKTRTNILAEIKF